MSYIINTQGKHEEHAVTCEYRAQCQVSKVEKNERGKQEGDAAMFLFKENRRSLLS